MTGDDIKPDVKPSDAQLRAQNMRKKKYPEGRVGSLVVMKSGKVKVVMGNDIVMNVSIIIYLLLLFPLPHSTQKHLVGDMLTM